MQNHPSTSIATPSNGHQERAGRCVCGVPVADHFDRDNRALECDAARRQWQGRLEVDRSHRALVETCLATIALSRSGRTPTGSALESLSDTEQKQVRYLAQAAITALDVPSRKAARERGVLAGLEAYRRWIGQREVAQKTEYQLRSVFADVLNAHDCALQGVTPITDAERARVDGTPVTRVVEGAQQSEGTVM